MKKFSFIIIAAAIITACNSTNPPENKTSDEAVHQELAIIRLSPQMREQVLVSPIAEYIRKPEVLRIDSSDGNTYFWDLWQGDSLYYKDTLALANAQFIPLNMLSTAQQQLGLSGTNPYILLDNDFAIIDWKWRSFIALSGSGVSVRQWLPLSGNSYSTNPYYNNGFIANEEYYLINMKWEELEDISSTWNITEGKHIDKPEVRYIKLDKLKEYNASEFTDIEDKYLYAEYNISEIYNALSKDNDSGLDFITQNNKAQEICVQTLNKIIKNNDFDALTVTRQLSTEE